MRESDDKSNKRAARENEEVVRENREREWRRSSERKEVEGESG